MKVPKGDELLDLVDLDDNLIGSVLKSAAHGNPTFIHREIAVCIFNLRGEALIQQRSLKKKIGPGEWKISCAGHVEHCEEFRETAIREAREELGIDIDPVFYRKIFDNDVENKEAKFYYIFYTVVKNDIQVALDTEEVNAIAWVSWKDLENHKNKYGIDGISREHIVELGQSLDAKNQFSI